MPATRSRGGRQRPVVRRGRPDLLDGGTGADFLNGGAGDDRFIYGPGLWRRHDFRLRRGRGKRGQVNVAHFWRQSLCRRPRARDASWKPTRHQFRCRRHADAPQRARSSLGADDFILLDDRTVHWTRSADVGRIPPGLDTRWASPILTMTAATISSGTIRAPALSTYGSSRMDSGPAAPMPVLIPQAISRLTSATSITTAPPISSGSIRPRSMSIFGRSWTACGPGASTSARIRRDGTGRIGDFNGDGTSDIAWYNPTTNNIDIWKLPTAMGRQCRCRIASGGLSACAGRRLQRRRHR